MCAAKTVCNLNPDFSQLAGLIYRLLLFLGSSHLKPNGLDINDLNLITNLDFLQLCRIVDRQFKRLLRTTQGDGPVSYTHLDVYKRQDQARTMTLQGAA